MIVGLGVEWVDVPRFAAALRRRPDRLARRLFTEAELAHVAGRRDQSQALAVRFAAKVAGRRALGLSGARWGDLEVVREPDAAPRLRLHGAAAQAADRLGVERVTLSLTHDAQCGIGQVVLEGGYTGKEREP